MLKVLTTEGKKGMDEKQSISECFKVILTFTWKKK